jgi:hypothetical protein
MSGIQSYCKILTIGSIGTEHVFDGPVVIQEKSDGSFFGFGMDENGDICCRSRGQQIDMVAPNDMFAEAVRHIRFLAPYVTDMKENFYFYAEWLQKPKHNTLAYARRPKNGLVLFDAVLDGRIVTERDELCHWADEWGIDVIPELHRGLADLAACQTLLTTESYLGGVTIEGVVIKNFGQMITFGSNAYPLFAKLVRQEFKERNDKEWKAAAPRGKLDAYLDSFRSEARWAKAVQRLRDAGLLEGSPRDIGPLLAAVSRDIEEEEADNIRNELYALLRKDILKHGTAGLAEWYKALLTQE